MKPVRSALFFMAVMGLLLVVSLLMPEQGIDVAGKLNIHFISLEDLFRRDTLNIRAYIERLLAGSTVTEDPEFKPVQSTAVSIAGLSPETQNKAGSNAKTQIGEEGVLDTEVRAATAIVEPPLRVSPANRDSLIRSAFPIIFPDNDREMLHPFFQKLAGLREGTVPRTRILHFGDSQIENDRMTALIRFRLQWHFGGSGTGLVPAVPLYDDHLAYEKEEYGNWRRYTFFGKRDTSIRHRKFGVMSAFASVPGSSFGEWPMLHYRFNTRRQTGRFDRIRIFTHSFTDDARIAFRVNDSISDTLSNIINGFNVADYSPGVTIKDLKISMGFPEGGRIYGISFESDRGIQVDNIAMRGSSGLTFSRMDRSLLEDMIGELSPGLILLQFGGNVVPYLDAGFYKNAFRRELAFFREICPDVPIILIGPADMSTKEKGIFVSYSSIEPIRNALRDAALQSGAGFWDLYRAMGGRNSMPGFVEANPPLATTDYVHFTPLGANLVAEMFYNSLMVEYNRYLTQYESAMMIPDQP